MSAVDNVCFCMSAVSPPDLLQLRDALSSLVLCPTDSHCTGLPDSPSDSPLRCLRLLLLPGHFWHRWLGTKGSSQGPPACATFCLVSETIIAFICPFFFFNHDGGRVNLVLHTPSLSEVEEQACLGIF